MLDCSLKGRYDDGCKSGSGFRSCFTGEQLRDSTPVRYLCFRRQQPPTFPTPLRTSNKDVAKIISCQYLSRISIVFGPPRSSDSFSFYNAPNPFNGAHHIFQMD